MPTPDEARLKEAIIDHAATSEDDKTFLRDHIIVMAVTMPPPRKDA